MKHLSCLLFFFALSTTLWAQPPGRGQILLSGLVVTPAPETGSRGLEEVLVEIVGTSHSTNTDQRGQFVFTQAPEGEVSLKFSKVGYKSVMRTAKIDKRQLLPPSFTVQMLLEGAQESGNILSGRDTVYVTYSQRRDNQAHGGEERLSDLDLHKRLVVTGPDGVFNPLTDSPAGLYPDPSKRPTNPVTSHPNSLMLYPPTSPQRSSFLKLNSKPYHLVFDQRGERLYTAGEEKAIKVFDADQNHERIAVLPTRGTVTDLNRSDDGRWILATVSNGKSSEILIIDSTNSRPAAALALDIEFGFLPTHVSSGPAETLLVTLSRSSGHGLLLVVDAYTGATLHSIPVGDAPTCVSTSPDKSQAFVVNSQSGSVTVVDLRTGKPLGLLPVGVQPLQSAVTPDGNSLLVTNCGSDTLSVVDLQELRVSGFLRVGKGPSGLAVSPDGKTCYIANQHWGNLSVVDLESLKLVHLTDPLPLSQPLGVTIRP